MVLIQLSDGGILCNNDHIVIRGSKYLPGKMLHDLGPQTNLFSE